MLKSALTLLVVVSCLTLRVGTVKAEGPSFDCKQASTAAEKIICASPVISSLDAEMARSFSAKLRIAADPAALRSSQRAWLIQRNRCVQPDCVIAALQVRIGQLASGTFTATGDRPDPLHGGSRPGFRGVKVGDFIVNGSRAGMVARVEAVHGLGTADAEIDYKQTVETASKYCEEYLMQNPPSQKCIDDRIKDVTPNSYRGNCQTGIFYPPFNHPIKFLGKNTSKSPDIEILDTDYLLQDTLTGKILGAEMASGYSVDLDIYRNLCPGYVETAQAVTRPPNFGQCADPDLIRQVTETAVQAGFQHLMNIKIIDFNNIRSISETATEKTCSATILLNSGGERTLIYSQYLRHGESFIRTRIQ